MERSDLDFIRDMLVSALNEKRDSIVGDLFKLYEEVQNRPTIPGGDINIDNFLSNTDYNFSLSSDYMPQAAGAVDLAGGWGDDVISFGDYKSQEYRPE
jgi:hypothetical protein